MTDRIAPATTPIWVDRLSDIPVIGSPVEEVIKGIDSFIAPPGRDEITDRWVDESSGSRPEAPKSPLPSEPAPGLGSLLQEHMDQSLSELDGFNEGMRQAAPKG